MQICRATHADIGNLSFIEGDVLDLDLPAGTADAVSALEMLYYVVPETWPRFFDTVARLLRPGGLLLVSLNVFSPDGAAGEAELLDAVGERFRIVETRHMHRMHYYRLELPLIRLLDEITYLERVKVFYPHTLSIGHVVYSPRLDSLLLPPNRLLDRLTCRCCGGRRWRCLARRACTISSPERRADSARRPRAARFSCSPSERRERHAHGARHPGRGSRARPIASASSGRASVTPSARSSAPTGLNAPRSTAFPSTSSRARSPG